MFCNGTLCWLETLWWIKLVNSTTYDLSVFFLVVLFVVALPFVVATPDGKLIWDGEADMRWLGSCFIYWEENFWSWFCCTPCRTTRHLWRLTSFMNSLDMHVTAKAAMANRIVHCVQKGRVLHCTVRRWLQKQGQRTSHKFSAENRMTMHVAE
jgi:hypothetical protein